MFFLLLVTARASPFIHLFLYLSWGSDGETGAGIPSATLTHEDWGWQGGLCNNPSSFAAASLQRRLPEGEGGEREAEEAAETAQTGREETLPGQRGRRRQWVGGGLPLVSLQLLYLLLTGFWREAAPRARARAAGPSLPHVPVPVQSPHGSPHVPRLRGVAADPIPASHARRAHSRTELPPFSPGETLAVLAGGRAEGDIWVGLGLAAFQGH